MSIRISKFRDLFFFCNKITSKSHENENMYLHLYFSCHPGFLQQ